MVTDNERIVRIHRTKSGELNEKWWGVNDELGQKLGQSVQANDVMGSDNRLSNSNEMVIVQVFSLD